MLHERPGWRAVEGRTFDCFANIYSFHRIGYDAHAGMAMTHVISEDTLQVLRRDRSKRAAHFACLKAIPFCTKSETLEDGVARLGAWLDVSLKLNHRPLTQVVAIVLACFLVDNTQRVTCVAELNETWLEIARDVVSPCATTIGEQYLVDAQIIARCTLYKFMPQTYGKQLLSMRPKSCSCETRWALEELQHAELMAQARRRVVSKLVECAVRNVLKRVSDDSRGARLRLKKQRRNLVKSMQHVSLADTANEMPMETEQVDLPLEVATAPLAALEAPDSSRASDECLVCFESLGSKRPLLTCGHARCCAVCTPKLQECPMCQKSVRILMEIFA